MNSHSKIFEERPWGNFEVLSEKPDHKVKRITLHPGRQISLQRHQRRQEHWFIVAGSAELTIDDKKMPLLAGDSANIPLRAIHRIKNTGHEDLVFIEVQTGESFSEDDIERIADDYGRAP